MNGLRAKPLDQTEQLDLLAPKPVRVLDACEADASHGCAWLSGCGRKPEFRVTAHGRVRDFCELHVDDAVAWSGEGPVPFGVIAY